MHGFNTSDQNTITPTHEDFHWISGPGRNERFADFIELVRDGSAGISTCLHLIQTSDLLREMNQDAEPEQLSAPSISKTDAANLFRLSLLTASVLLKASQDNIDLLNRM